MIGKPETEDEQIARHRAEGRSEQEIQYFLAKNQKDYEPLLKDMNTPEKVITDIVDRITLVPLKILAFQHPNLSQRSLKYMLEKADKKKDQKELIKAFLTAPRKLAKDIDWVQLRRFYNTAKRLDKFIIELLYEQVTVSTATLYGLLNALGADGMKEEKMLKEYITVITGHKNFMVDILLGDFFLDDPNLMYNDDVIAGIEKSPKKTEIYEKFYEMTKDEKFLPEEVKDIFLF